MGTTWPIKPTSRKALNAWIGLYILHAAGIGIGVMLFGYGVLPLRTEKMEVVYRIEGVPFAAGPQGVPPDKWERMQAVDLEIVEPMANWVKWAGAALAASSLISMLLIRFLHPWRDQPGAEEVLGSD
ncbi:MAG TPA: hypothetical protein VLM40_00815, partial [Gemmata sp.]|nr:hypothetical protein [Gemmata sp.]